MHAVVQLFNTVYLIAENLISLLNYRSALIDDRNFLLY